ncbi:hypothetical protein AB0K93_19215 [Streptomyces sp. NPDC052676]|uniref:hypothetical protein n=1 Tax=Streptomyces sp. NPDC052676 TaxID=3154953 RepID=UPI0034280C85
MYAARKRMSIAIGAGVVVVLLGCAAYLLKIPPFEEQAGEITENSLCDSMGPSPQSVASLKKALPGAASYGFADDVTLRGSVQDDSYTSTCFVSGGGKELMTVRTQMMRAESARSWVDSEIKQYAGDPSRLTSFEAGERGVASPSVAAVFVPCVSRGVIPGGQYNLSVVVHLKEPGEVSAARTRSALIDLARSAATYAHSEAKCEMPSRIS